MMRKLAGLLFPLAALSHAQTDFQQAVRPILAARCVACHNTASPSGKLDLEQFRDSPTALRLPAVWQKVRARVSTGTMPPPAAAQPTPAERAALLAWIDAAIGPAAPNTPDPGRVTARRLNRTEYNNTIRDLLGVTLRPADEFPTDDSGYGFDNIGDVLSVSPLLAEKWMSAAARISRAAIYGEPYSAEPGLIVKIKPKRSQDDSPATGDVFPYSMRGALFGAYHFPVDAEYEFRWRYSNLRPTEVQLPPLAPGARRGPLTPEQRREIEERNRIAAPPIKMVFTIDGKPALTKVVEGNTDYDYSRGETVARVRLTAGDHFLRISFPELANLDDPRTHINRDLRRKLFVDYLDIVGPFRPSKAPSAGYRRIFLCGHEPGAHQPLCARRAVETLARRAYRRPATPEEIDPLLKLVGLAQQRGDTLEEGVRLSLQAVLMSPNFLFRIEREPARRAGPYRLSDHELASRLSYFIWSSMPDDDLLRAADRGELRQPAALEAQVRRMLQDPKSSALAEDFAAQWLNLRVLDRKKPDPQLFPTVDDELLDAMRRETLLFVTTLIREDRGVLDVIHAPFTFLNGPLARHYGIKGVDGEEFQRVDLKGLERGGIVTQGSILTLSSYATRTSPVLRGKWVLETLLGTPMPPPPEDVPPLQEANIGKDASLRQRLEQHRASPACAACHNQMDPLGFSLENFDAAGRWRTRDGNFDVDNVGTLPDGRTIAGPKGLKEILRFQSELFTRNFTEKLLTFALGRGLERPDIPVVQAIAKQAAVANHRFSSLVLGIVRSDPFQMRKGAEGAINESK